MVKPCVYCSGLGFVVKKIRFRHGGSKLWLFEKVVCPQCRGRGLLFEYVPQRPLELSCLGDYIDD